jgi:hypothetical protein
VPCGFNLPPLWTGTGGSTVLFGTVSGARTHNAPSGRTDQVRAVSGDSMFHHDRRVIITGYLVRVKPDRYSPLFFLLCKFFGSRVHHLWMLCAIVLDQLIYDLLYRRSDALDLLVHHRALVRFHVLQLL